MAAPHDGPSGNEGGDDAIGQALGPAVARAMSDPAGSATTVKEQARAVAQTATQAAQTATQTAAQAAQSATQTAAQAAQSATQTAAQAAQTAADAQTVFEVERERALARERTAAPPRQARVAQQATEPLRRGDVRTAVQARRRLPSDVERKIGWLAALDARTFLLVNGLPRTRPLNQFMLALTIITNAGAAWIAVLGGMAFANHSVAARRAFLSAAPVVSGTAWAVEGPIKGRVRRRRPFLTLEEAVVIGGRPKNWSFPSGHTASAFAAATIAARDFPQSSLPLYALATLVGFSRIYLGAHFPSDVASGALIGTLAGLAGPPILRGLAPRLFCADRGNWWRRLW